MTIGIAAITQDEKFIVVASDRMLSHGDVIQAADDAALKMRRVAKSWGVTFAGEANRFLPILDRGIELLDDLDDKDEKEVREAMTSAYRQEVDEAITASILARLGYPSFAKFKERGLTELGETIFRNTLNKIESIDIGITLLVYGFDTIKMPSIFQISNPGIYTSHELLGCAAIGSGIYMATAALRRRPPKGDLEKTIYRVLEAKFSSETATGVGRTTTLLVTDSEGKLYFFSDPFIEEIRSAWLNEVQRPDPKEAMDLLRKGKIADRLEELPIGGKDNTVAKPAPK